MPPKQQPSKKAEAKKKEKIIEDKTFEFFMTNLFKIRSNNARMDLLKAAEAKKKKEIDDLRDVTKLIKPVEQKVQRDVDPKSVVCAFFKQGMCHKGAKCKFSHDLAVEQKTLKKNLYVDSRDLGKEDESCLVVEESDESYAPDVRGMEEKEVAGEKAERS
ncbi:hypothetical protein TELCIR_19217 [Teladorsagia circumcincta]|uniref:C3H1-type domain-containing protein n=1 Tax=Teladorsagia circumcincta TaxID=45464 RepID=A0A2G9TMY6_TELCI|nr:hypothetical protein TELCIR_19217 [Teladorsagia circumcincta]